MERHALSGGFGPVDVDLMRLLASLPPGRRIRSMLHTADFVRGLVRGRLRRLHPNVTDLELGLMVLEEIERVNRAQGRP